MTFLKLLFNKIFWKTIFELIYVWYIKKYVKYYTHIDYLPIENFAEILKGKFEYLFVGKKRRVPRIYFIRIFEEMNFQFKKLDNTHLRQLADLADYESKYVRTNNKRWLNEYNTLAAKIKSKKSEPFDLNNFTQYIEMSLKQPVGSFDIKMSTSRAFLAYQTAIETNKKASHANN